jgi:hypothetical protein
MRIRLTGTPAECEAAADLIARVIEVVDESIAYRTYPPTNRVRVYLEARVLAETHPCKEFRS